MALRAIDQAIGLSAVLQDAGHRVVASLVDLADVAEHDPGLFSDQRPWRAIAETGAPAFVAAVAPPARRLCAL
ncbi:hypothetical protein BCD49_39535 [Pseudofrankia sp. EUN1h]|nr:hypothetical protein BCD49_39535 [Pseudofrankia sp. EUN1h]